jgi:hypothetical protein
MWSLNVKNNPSKTYIRNIIKLREISTGITETRQKAWKINVGKREG